jgi:hypothetical protein
VAIRKPDSSITLLTDDLEIEPVLDSVSYSETIANVIRGTYPRFSIGIYGEWGTGKTTIMKLVEKDLRGSNIITIWFNAWRYEREEQFAAIALMKTIAFGLASHEHYKDLAETIYRGARKVGEAVVEKLLVDAIGESGIEKIKEIPKKTELLAKIEKDTIYFDGLKKIEEQMKQVQSKHIGSRIVVFIDDLDRCSPKKALEVFESVKVFLDIEGFIFVIGLSHETIAKLISADYEKSGIRGEDYIRKIIQVPIIVPEWNISDIDHLINRLAPKLGKRYEKILLENKKLISLALRPNPRELKCFINNFIVANEIFSSASVKERDLLAVQALKTTWNSFYRDMISDKEFYREVKKLVSETDSSRIAEINLLRSKKELEGTSGKVGRIEDDLWNFLIEAKDTIFGISDWEVYRRAVSATAFEEVQGYEMVEVKERVRDDVSRNRLRYLKSKKERLETTIRSLEQKLDDTTTPSLSMKIQDDLVKLGFELKQVQTEIINLGG